MKVAIGCDHGGFALKEAVRAYLEQNHIDYKDFGAYSEESVDYAPIAAQAARYVASGQADRGVLICSTGIGISIAANKVKGIRAALCTNEFCAEMTRATTTPTSCAWAARWWTRRPASSCWRSSSRRNLREAATSGASTRSPRLRRAFCNSTHQMPAAAGYE